MRRSFCLTVIAFLLFALSAPGADLSGTWHGSVDVSHGGDGTSNTRVQLRLEQKGDTLSGEIGHEGDPTPVKIQNGRIEGNSVYFEASSEETKGPIRFRLKLDGERLTGEMSGAIEEGKITGQVKLTRGSE